MAVLQKQKRLMAMAGVAMTAYLIFHVLSNLTLLSAEQSQQFFDWYQQAWIRWPILLLFCAALVIHIVVAVRIRRQNFQARRIDYFKHDKFHVPASLVTLSILLLFAFIVFHLMQTLNLDSTDIQIQVMHWFESEWLTLMYIAGVSILSMHLLHSLINVLQSLAITTKQYVFFVAIAVGLMFIGFVSVPLTLFWSQL